MSDKDEPWTADDIRKNAPNWSLHCDGKLLEYMKNLSRTIEERGNRTTYNLHNSMLELDRTKIVLENATNNLMALQHKQFVENRVYDDDETIANIDNVPVTDTDQTDKPNISAADVIRDAIETGMKLLNQHFDKVTYELSDSDDDGDEVEKSVVYRPKNPYKHRPLPYLIGSKEWHEKWHIGLIEEDSDQSENENNEDEEEDGEDEEIQSMSSSPAISVSSNVPVSLSEYENPTGVIPSKRSNAQDLFQSSSEENVSKLPHEIADSDLTFRRQSHDANTVQIPKRINDPNEINTNNSIFMPQKSQMPPHVIPTLIDSDPPELDDGPSISTTRNAHKPPNLFLDDDGEDEDDFIFDSNKQSKGEKKSNALSIQPQSGRKTNSINLFADEDENDSDNFDSFLPTTSKVADLANSTQPNQQKSEPIRNLFDNDDEDDDDELFLPPPSSSSSTGPATKTIPNRSSILSSAPKKDVFQYNLFDDKPPDDDFDSIPSKQSDSTVVQTTSKKLTSNLFSTNVNLFAEDDNDDDDDIFEKLITPSSSKKQPIKEDNKSKINFEIENSEQNNESTKKDEPTSSTIDNKSNLFNPRGLFDDTPPSDDDDSQLFSNISKNKDNATNKVKPVDVVKKTTKEFYNDFSETVTVISTDDKMPKVPETVKTTEPTQNLEKVDSTPKNSSSEIQLPTNKSPTKDAPKQKPVQNKSSDNANDNDGMAKEKRSEFMKKIDAFSNSNVNESKSETTVPVPKARQPKKLNIGSIDINVAALLPGAKRAKSVDKTDNKDHSDDISSSDDTSTASQTTTTTKAISQDNIDNSGRLVNLNRNRVKNLSRRPSTRAGRKHQYQKSMDSEEHIDGILNELEKEVVSPPTTTMTDQSINDNNKEQIAAEPITSSPTKKLTKSPISKVIFEDDDIFETTESAPMKMAEEIEESTEEVSSSNPIKEDEQLTSEMVEEDNPFSFLDDKENDENDEFLYAEPKTPPPTYTNTMSVKATPAYIDELPPDLEEDPIEDKSYDSKNVKGGTSLSQNALSLFGDDDDDDFENDEIFNSPPDRTDQPPDIPSDTNKPENDWSPYSENNKKTSPESASKQHQVSSALSLFDDDDDPDDGLDDKDIFGSKTNTSTHSISNTKTTESPPTPSIAKPPPDSSIFDGFDNDSEIDKISEPKIPKIDETAQKTKSPTSDKTLPVSSVLGLFDDDEDPDDAVLFGSKPVTKLSNVSKVQGEKEKTQQPKSISTTSSAAKTSLFGDNNDDDDGDDLFGGGGPPPLPEPIKQIQPKKVSQKIFSDDSSDDDLFGGGGKVVAQKNLSKPSAAGSGSSGSTSAMSKTAKNTKTNERLFSDSEDDDLFGGSKSKSTESSSKNVKSTSLAKAIKEDPTKSVKMLSPSSVDNDPLADLLK